MRLAPRYRLALLAALSVGSTLALPAALASAGPSAAGSHPVRVCARAHAGFAACDSYIQVNADNAPLVATAAKPGYGPSSLQSAYALTSAAASNGAGVTIAIVDAYNDKTAAKDLKKYRAHYGLPACTPATGCLKIVNQNGGSSLPGVDSTGGWELEESLDLDMVSAICPKCNILLVETNSNAFTDLGTGVNTAASTAGVRAVSNSYGGGEFSSETSYDSTYFNHPGVAITVSAGDGGYGVEYPAASPNVTAVGGTKLVAASNSRGWTETVWGSANNANGGTGSGCSQFETKPSWQNDSGCQRRTVADVSADADPASGASVYDTTPYHGSVLGWISVGGTSEAAPIIAGVYGVSPALASGTWSSNLYSHTGSLNDVTSGTNGSCGGSYLCTGKVGYDGPTGLGTPNGTGAF